VQFHDPNVPQINIQNSWQSFCLCHLFKIKKIMLRYTLIFSSLFIGTILNAQINLNSVRKQAESAVNSNQNTSRSNLSNDEVVKGLREALTIGTNNAASSASRLDGFNKNNLIKIPFPPQASAVESKARQLGMGPQVDRFVTTMNRAAEEASKEAAPIFINAVKGMSINDGMTILRGGDNAATNFLQNRTTAELTTKFQPSIKRAIDKVELTKLWNPIISNYNRIPGVTKQNPNLEAYVTQKTIEGLFKLIAQEESKIRKDPAAQVTNILRRVFGGG